MPTIYALELTYPSGIYFQGVELYFDPKMYIGCTSGNLGKRLREHRCLLKGGKHTCKPLQDDFTKKGGELTIRQLEEVTRETRREREVYWMMLIGQRAYNEHLISFRPPEGAPAKAAAARVANGYKPSAESNEKRRLAQLGVPKGHGAKISATKRARAMR